MMISINILGKDYNISVLFVTISISMIMFLIMGLMYLIVSCGLFPSLSMDIEMVH